MNKVHVSPKYVFSICVLFVFLLSCKSSMYNVPGHLRKLTKRESFERNLKGIPPAGDIVFKLMNGDTVNQNELSEMLNDCKYTLDEYVDRDTLVREFVLRPERKRDRKWSARLQTALQNRGTTTTKPTSLPTFKLINVNCDHLVPLLDKIFKDDQEIRKDMSKFNPQIDYENQQIVVSIIETCGFPTGQKVGKKGILTIFLVIQHAHNSLREKYFSQFKKAAERKDLSLSNLATMEDRILVDQGKKQLYGTQLFKMHSDSLKLYPILDPENVNERRAKVGMGPIEEYLEQFGINTLGTSQEY